MRYDGYQAGQLGDLPMNPEMLAFYTSQPVQAELIERSAAQYGAGGPPAAGGGPMGYLDANPMIKNGLIGVGGALLGLGAMWALYR